MDQRNQAYGTSTSQHKHCTCAMECQCGSDALDAYTSPCTCRMANLVWAWVLSASTWSWKPRAGLSDLIAGVGTGRLVVVGDGAGVGVWLLVECRLQVKVSGRVGGEDDLAARAKLATDQPYHTTALR